LNRKQVLLAGVLLLVALVPAIEEFNVASLTFMVLALGTGRPIAIGTVSASEPPRYAIFIWSAHSDFSAMLSLPSICRH
jgi:hypothetical protein